MAQQYNLINLEELSFIDDVTGEEILLTTDTTPQSKQLLIKDLSTFVLSNVDVNLVPIGELTLGTEVNSWSRVYTNTLSL